MSLSHATLTKVTTAVTAASGATNKVAALVRGIVDATLEEVCATVALTPNQQQHVAEVRADIVANTAAFQTAVGL